MSPCDETSIRVQVQGTTFMAVYEVLDGTLMLTSADFGEAQSPLDGRTPEQAAADLLRTLAEAAMAGDGDTYLRDDKSTQPDG